MIKLFKQNGWVVKRVKGSHHIMKNQDGKIAVIPVHGNRDLHTGIQKDLLNLLELP